MLHFEACLLELAKVHLYLKVFCQLAERSGVAFLIKLITTLRHSTVIWIIEMCFVCL